jgi:hypothetical protein
MAPLHTRTVRFHQPSPIPASNVARLAQQSLHESSYLELRNVDCDYTGGVLTLRGRVSSFHMKQIAQVIAARVVDVECLNYQLEVLDASHLDANDGSGHDFLHRATAH